MHTYIFGTTQALAVFLEKNSVRYAGNAVERIKHKILSRLSKRNSFVSWKKTYKMLMRLKIERKELRKLEMRADYEKCCRRKMMAHSRGC